MAAYRKSSSLEGEIRARLGPTAACRPIPAGANGIGDVLVEF
jgi:hypothetical protein